MYTSSEKQISFRTYAHKTFDTSLRCFSVPKAWAYDWIMNYGMTSDEFKNEATWDDTFVMYKDAIDECVIITDNLIDKFGREI